MGENVVGINEERLNKLILDVFEYANKANKIFNQAAELVEKTKTYYVSESGEAFRKKYEALADNYQTINQNLLSYATELTNVKKKYNVGVASMVDQFNIKK